MRYLNRELIIFLIALRWIGLFLGMISYVKNYEGTILMMLPLAFINIVYTLNMDRNIPQYKAFTIVLFDLFFSLILCYQTNGFNSPFFLYSFTTFIWLTFHASFPSILVVAVWYSAMTLGMELFVRPELIPLQLSKFIWEGQLLLVIFMFVFILHHYGKTIVMIYRDIYLIQRVAGMTVKLDLKGLTTKLENLLYSLFSVQKALICWCSEEEQKDWQHRHYYHLLKNEKNISKKRLEYHRFQGVDGQVKNVVTFPVKGDARDVIAYIILVHEQPLTIKRFSLLYLHLIAFVVYHRYQVIRQTHIIEDSMKQEVRTKLAQDMHDGLAQQLFFLNAKAFQLKMLTKKYDDQQLLEIIDQIGFQVENSHQEVRNYIESLRNIHKESNMSYAVEQLVEKMAKGHNLEVELNYETGIEHEAVEIEETIYRFVEEAMNNVLKHAHATKVEVTLQCNSIEWVILVKDNGIGMKSLSTVRSGRFGVRGMKERIEKLRGQVLFESIPQEGTTVMAVIPRKRGSYV